MAVRKVQYTLPEGQQTIADPPNLAARVVLKVKREGMCYYKVLTNTTDPMEVLHRPIFGQLKFHIPANAGGEKVYVLIKE